MGKNSRAGKKQKTPKAIQQARVRFDNEATLRACKNYANLCLSKYQLAEMLVLHDKFGFGKVRLKRLIDNIITVGEAIQEEKDGEEYLLPSDIYNLFSDLYGDKWMRDNVGSLDMRLK